jgi:hydrogenase maturation protease
VSPHDPGVKEALLTLEFSGNGPEDVLLVGVVPEKVGSHVGLSGPVRSALEEVEAEVVRELERLGHRVEPRDPPEEPDIWWERDAGEDPR